jgi:hypothetical protein
MNLESKHNQAIRDEIADRLRSLLSRDPAPVSARLRAFLRRFDSGSEAQIGLVARADSRLAEEDAS